MPPAILAAGVVQVAANSNGEMIFEGPLRAAIIVVALVPLLVAIVLGRISPGFDSALAAVATTLTSMGMALQVALAFDSNAGNAFYIEIATRYGFFVGGGFLALLAGAIAAKHIDAVTRFPYVTVLTALILIATTVALGDTVNGARLWLQAGPIRFQPSEVSRLLLTMFLAAYLYNHRYFVASTWRVGTVDLPAAPYLLPLAGALLAAVVVLVFQNDLGMAALTVLGALALVTSVLRSRASATAAVVLTGLAISGAFFVFPRFRDRIAAWLEPWGAPRSGGFQLIQADYGLSTGGIVTSGNQAMTAAVPEVHTDLVLIGLGGHFGLLVAVAAIALSGVLVVHCAINALRAPVGFGGLLAAGLTIILGFQVVLISAGTLRLLPLTGVTFPLVSYGGTSMVVTLLTLGLILGIGARTN